MCRAVVKKRGPFGKTLISPPVPITLFFILYISTLNTSLRTSITNISKSIVSNLSYLNNFHSLEGVGRVSETHLQVGENAK